MQNTWTYKHVASYLKLMRAAFAAARAGRLVRFDWCGPELDLAGVRADFLDALECRINLKVAPEPTYRKLQPIYQTGLMRDSHRVRQLLTSRVRVYQFETPEARNRFGHLLSRYDD